MPLEPQKHSGPWKVCYSLAPHTVSSTFLGYDERGREKFDTTRSRLGEAVYQLKYGGDRSLASNIAKAVAEFVVTKAFPVDLVVPLPPSKKRSIQPVQLVAQLVAKELGIAYDSKALLKVRDTDELKSLAQLHDREDALRGAFSAGPSAREKVVLLLDDLIRSGVSMRIATETLLNEGGATAVYAVALTRTRINR